MINILILGIFAILEEIKILMFGNYNVKFYNFT